MNFKLDPKSAVLGAVLVLSGALAADELPGLIQHVFKAGDPIRAAEVNANFANLGNAFHNLQNEIAKPIPTERLADGSVTGSKIQSQTQPVDGYVLGYQSGGKLAWIYPRGPQGPQGQKGDKGDKGDKGEQGNGAYTFYRKIDVRAVPVRGKTVRGRPMQCDDSRDLAVGGFAQRTGGDSGDNLSVTESYPIIGDNRNDRWYISIRNNYNNDNSIIYVDYGLSCVSTR